MQQSFQTTLQRIGSRIIVPIPFDPNTVWRQKTRHDVTGTINGLPFRGPLVAEGDRYFLSIGAAWRRDSGLDEGDAVQLVLSPEGPQQATLATDITAALDAAPAAASFFGGLATFYRKNFIRWIESAKRPETRAARIADMIDLLNAGKRER